LPRFVRTVEEPGVDEMSGMPRLGYRPALDGVRGIAIAIVVAFHAFGWPGEGTLGVDLFFVLSGFLITTLLLEEHAATGRISIRGFYGRRARRLLPALLVLLAPFLLVAATVTTVGSLGSPLIVGLASALTYTSNIVVAADPSAASAWMIHLWSLAAEEQFYILWPLLLIVLMRVGGLRLVGRALIGLLMVAVVYRLQFLARGASIERLYYAPDTHADSLLVGCAFGCYFSRGRLPLWILSSTRVQEVVSALSLGLIIAAAVLLGHVPERLSYELQLVPTAFALVAGVFIVCAVTGGSIVVRGLSVRPLVFLGRISYSLYLWHVPLLVAIAGVHRGVEVRTIAAVAVALVVATCSWRFVETPFLRRRVRAGAERVISQPAAPHGGVAVPDLAVGGVGASPAA
jgi:peptidoglycan/LPS O-acetylase OafA/YrhL